MKKILVLLALLFSSSVFGIDQMINAPTGRLILNSSSSINTYKNIQGVDGSLTAPTYGFTSQSNTGIYQGSTNQINMCTAGTDRLLIKNNGNIDPVGGFGTTTDGAASASTSGLVTTGTQTFAGAKTFNGAIDANGGFTADTNAYATTSLPGLLPMIKPITQSICYGASGNTGGFPASSASGTYTVPAGVVWLRVRMVGGGGGGNGGGTSGSGGSGGNGGNSTFGSVTATGGNGSSYPTPIVGSSGVGSLGLTVYGGAGNIGNWATGTAGTGGTSGLGATTAYGGTGGGSALGSSIAPQSAGTCIAGHANSGVGGTGGGCTGSALCTSGQGGGGGGYVDVVFTGLTATYSYAAGGAGSAGIAGSGSGNAGCAGGSGIIIVEEHYY